MAAFDQSSRPAKRQKTEATASPSSQRHHPKRVKQVVYGKPTRRRNDEFTIDGKAVHLSPRQSARPTTRWDPASGDTAEPQEPEEPEFQEDLSQDELNDGQLETMPTPTKKTPTERKRNHGKARGFNDQNASLSDTSEIVQTPSKKRRKYKGWAWMGDEDQPVSTPVNNQDQFAKIAQEAAEEAVKEAAKEDAGAPERRRRALRQKEKEASPGVDKAASKQSASTMQTSGRKGWSRKISLAVADHIERSETESRVESGDRPMKDGSADALAQSNESEGEADTPVANGRGTRTRQNQTEPSNTNGDEDSPFTTARGTILEPKASTEEFENLFDSQALELKKMLEEIPDLLTMVKTYILEGLTGKRRLPLVNLNDAYQKVHQLLSQTVLAGEGNSMLVIGSRGSGKTTLVETVISDLSSEHRDDFHTVRLNGFIHTDDKLALREIWRQLGREMDVEDETTTGRSNYADTLTSLLALLSHSNTTEEEEKAASSSHPTAAKSIIFLLDEFDLFASHPRQTLLYNLFDIAQSRNAPIAVLGLTTKLNISDTLEKRVKSRFSQRHVQLSLPKSFQAYHDIALSALTLPPPATFLHLPPNKSHSPNLPPNLTHLWNTYTARLLTHPSLHHPLTTLYHTTKHPPHLPLLSPLITPLSPTSPLPLPPTIASQPITQPTPLSLLPTLSTLSLSLLISAARLEILLSTPLCTFQTVYDEYISLTSKTRLQSSAAGQMAVGGLGGGRVWSRHVAGGEWEVLGGRGLVVSAGGGAGGRGKGGGVWRVEVGLEEIGGWIEGEGGVGVRGLGRWCREL